MKTIRTFAKSVDAHTFAAWLSSSGVEAIVQEESGFGGNLLSTTTPGAIRVEVTEDDWELAQKLSNEWVVEKLPTKTPEFPDRIDSSRQLVVFRVILVSEFLIFLISSFAPDLFYGEVPDEIEPTLNEMAFSEQLWGMTFAIGSIFGALSFLASVLLFFFAPLGRPLFLITLAWFLLVALTGPGTLATPAGAFLAGFGWVLSGIIVTMCYVGAVAEHFDRVRAAE